MIHLGIVHPAFHPVTCSQQSVTIYAQKQPIAQQAVKPYGQNPSSRAEKIGLTARDGRSTITTRNATALTIAVPTVVVLAAAVALAVVLAAAVALAVVLAAAVALAVVLAAVMALAAVALAVVLAAAMALAVVLAAVVVPVAAVALVAVVLLVKMRLISFGSIVRRSMRLPFGI
jgi:hypothetical protein